MSIFPSRKKPAEAIATDKPSAPHPLDLNPSEGRWLNLVSGPIDGWFSCAEHGNPPFDTPVQVVVSNENTKCIFVAVGTRTRDLDPQINKERWIVNSQFGSYAGGICFWRPLSPLPKL